MCGHFGLVYAVQSVSPSRLSSASDGSASSTPGAAAADSDALAQQSTTASVKRRQVTEV